MQCSYFQVFFAKSSAILMQNVIMYLKGRFLREFSTSQLIFVFTILLTASTCRTEVGKLAGERASLLKKLVEVEMDGKAAGEQLIKLRDTIRKLKEVKLLNMA